MPKQMDEAVFYAETLRDLGVADPLGGETPADKELRASDAKWTASKNALSEIVTKGWDRTSAPVAGRPNKRKARTNGQAAR